LRILILGSDNLAAPLAGLGHEVLTAGPQPDAGLPLHQFDPDWRELEPALRQRDFWPSVVLVTDDLGARNLPTGLWGCPALTVFYGVDAPLNWYWQSAYARLFDLAFLDQPAESRELSELHPEAHWLPVGIDYSLYEGTSQTKPQKGICFVGVVDDKVRPKRSAILRQFAKLAPISTFGGRQDQWLDTRRAAELYRSYDLVLNENLFPGVTTRPLEGMAAGGCVFSEAAPGSMDALFPEYQDLVYFSPQDWQVKLDALLNDASLRQSLAEQSRESVRAGHTLGHRAREISSHLERLLKSGQPHQGRAPGSDALRLEGQALLMAGLRWPGADQRRLSRALGRLRAAVRENPNSLFCLRMAGRAEAACGNWNEALHFMEKARNQGDEGDALSLALASWQAGEGSRARQLCLDLAVREAGLDCEPGSAGFHMGAARLLDGLGQDLSPGFDRRRLAPCLWNALEHLQKAVALEPGLASAWEMMGDILLEKRAPNQAHDCLKRALEIGHEERLATKARQAAWEGYLV
jgi:tetratricopeptide (TPR) repeat protein